MKQLIALAFAASLGGCAAVQGIESASGFAISQNQLDAARSSYDALVLTPAARYRQLGYCAAGTSAALDKPCADRAIVAKIRAGDAAVNKEFNQVQAMVTAENNTGAVAAFNTLEGLISTVEAVVVSAGVK